MDESELTFKTVVSWVIVITLILTVLISAYLITAVAFNDYVVYDLQTFIETQNDRGNLLNETVQASDSYGESFQQWVYNTDRIFILMYVLFFIESLLFSYFAKGMNYFSFFGFMFYGLMIVLFLTSLFINISQWWLDNFLINLIPKALTILPNYGWFLNRAGYILAIQLVLCMLANKLDLDLLRVATRKKKEQSVLDRGEL